MSTFVYECHLIAVYTRKSSFLLYLFHSLKSDFWKLKEKETLLNLYLSIRLTVEHE